VRSTQRVPLVQLDQFFSESWESDGRVLVMPCGCAPNCFKVTLGQRMKSTKDNHTLALQLFNLFFIEAVKVISQCIWIIEELDVLVSFKHQVPDITANENNLPYTSTKLAYGRSPSANSSL
jgi:hypothetical protein